MLTRRYALSLLFAAGLAGCTDRLDPTSPGLENSVFTLLGGLEVGESLSLSGTTADSVLLAGGDAGAEYLYVPFFASEGGRDRLQVEVLGSNVRQVSLGQVSAQRAPSGIFDEDRPQDHGRHERFLEQSNRELEARIPSIPRAMRSRERSLNRLPAAAAVPRVGDVVRVNTGISCGDGAHRFGRVEAVSRTAIVVSDTTNPGGGLTAADYQSFGLQFDDLVHPVLTRSFGEPTDIDSNGRSIIFFTRAVNEMTPPFSDSYVAGYFWAGDLFPRELCPASNQAEIFYLLAADPQGQVNNNAFTTQFVRSRSVGVIGHEFQHLINAGRRIYINDAEDWEAVWLNEGLSHIAEELLFYAAAGLQPRQNIDLDVLRSSQQVLGAVNTFQVANLARLSSYLEQPEQESLLGIDNLETRGATWAFLRYVADHDGRSDDQFFQQLVNSRVSGTENLSAALGADAIDLMQAWTVSVFTDDFISTANALHQQPSWNFRSIIPALYQNQRFPLKVLGLRPDTNLQLRLRGGGSAFVRLNGAAGRQALISTTSGGRTPPDRLRISIVRLR